MAIIKCPECGQDISDKAKTCPHCGCPIEEIKPKAKPAVKKKRPKLADYGLGFTVSDFTDGQMSSFVDNYLNEHNVTIAFSHPGMYGYAIGVKLPRSVWIYYGIPKALKAQKKVILNIQGSVTLNEDGSIPEENHINSFFNNLLESFKQKFPEASIKTYHNLYFEQLDLEINGRLLTGEERYHVEKQYYDRSIVGSDFSLGDWIYDHKPAAFGIFTAICLLIGGIFLMIIDPFSSNADSYSQYSTNIESYYGVYKLPDPYGFGSIYIELTSLSSKEHEKHCLKWGPGMETARTWPYAAPLKYDWDLHRGIIRIYKYSSTEKDAIIDLRGGKYYDSYGSYLDAKYGITYVYMNIDGSEID